MNKLANLAYNIDAMLISSDRFSDTPVMSLQTGSELARTSRAIIDPYSLAIVAYELTGPLLSPDTSLLRIADIREIGPLGMIIDSVDELISPSDVIKIKEIYELDFELVNVKVINEKKRAVGRVIGYTLEAGNFVIQQLRVKRPLLQSLGDTELLIHRSQIVKVTNSHITVKAATVRHTKPIAEPAQVAFENPFRKSSQSQPETADS